MDFEKTFPLRYYINLGRREDRRTELEFHLDQIGVTAQRFPAIDSRFCRNPRGYQPPFSPLRSGPRAASKPSRKKQIPSSVVG